MVGSQQVRGFRSARTDGARRATGVRAAAGSGGAWRPANGGARAGSGIWCLRPLHGEALDGLVANRGSGLSPGGLEGHGAGRPRIGSEGAGR